MKLLITPKLLASLVALVSLLLGSTRLAVSAAPKSLPGIPNHSMGAGSSLKDNTSVPEKLNEKSEDKGLEGDKNEISFEGTVDQVSQNLLVISGMSFTLDQNTKVEGNILVGDQVEVEFVQSGSGMQTALKVEGDESKAGDEDESETSLSNANSTDNSQIEDQSMDDSAITSDATNSSFSKESEITTNKTNSDERGSVSANSSGDEGRDNEHEGHD